MLTDSYENIITSLKESEKPYHLLLGNGFSIAYDPKIFSYNRLAEYISSQDGEIEKIVDIVKSENFEQIMHFLDLTIKICESFDSSIDLIKKLDDTKETIKKSLIDAIKNLHPSHIFQIPENEANICKNFLNPFLGDNKKIFTTNYDLLLYWTLMRPDTSPLNDGFNYRNNCNREEKNLTWKKCDDQCLFFLHGALHLFDTGLEIVKERYEKNQTDGLIIQRIKNRIEEKKYPMFISSGSSQEKLKQIRKNPYLIFAYEKLTQISGSLVTFGFNFHDVDHHIIEALNIASSKHNLEKIYIGVFNENDQTHIKSKKRKFKCKDIRIFNSSIVPVWKQYEPK